MISAPEKPLCLWNFVPSQSFSRLRGYSDTEQRLMITVVNKEILQLRGLLLCKCRISIHTVGILFFIRFVFSYLFCAIFCIVNTENVHIDVEASNHFTLFYLLEEEDDSLDHFSSLLLQAEQGTRRPDEDFGFAVGHIVVKPAALQEFLHSIFV